MNKRLITDWNIARILRLLIGISFIGQSIADKQWIFLIPGALLTYQGVLNIGCGGSCYTWNCNTGSCEVPEKSTK